MGHLYLLSVHYGSSYWLRVQRRFLDKFIDVPHTRLFACHGIDPAELGANEISFTYSGDHAEGLDNLASEALKWAKDDDWLLFLDSDAFPISPLSKVIEEVRDFTAVQRTENMDDKQPHPSFALVKVHLYKKLSASWSSGYFWRDRYGLARTDAGSWFLEALENSATPWGAYHRLNRRDFHFLYFAIYGPDNSTPVVYHHGAGSRNGTTRVERILRRKKPFRFFMLRALYFLRVSKLCRPPFTDFFSVGLSRKNYADTCFRRLIDKGDDFWKVLLETT